MLHTYGKMTGSHGGIQGIEAGHQQDAHETPLTPKEGFPGQDKLTIVCMGIDDNWTNSDVVYTANARTDTLFVLTLDLKHKKATMLSIPRDTYAHIVGTKNDWHFKINAAYTTGGPDRTVATVNEFLGTNANHYLVLNIDATKKMVDALGGVDVDVEHEMHYHDKWGHLSIDLHPGQQHLTATRRSASRATATRTPAKSRRPKTATSGACTASTFCCGRWWTRPRPSPMSPRPRIWWMSPWEPSAPT